MSEPLNDDLIPEHADIDSALAAAHREHRKRLAGKLNLEDGLAAILGPGTEPPAAVPGSPASLRLGPPLPSGQAASMIEMRRRACDFARDLASVLDRARALNLTLAFSRSERRRARTCFVPGVIFTGVFLADSATFLMDPYTSTDPVIHTALNPLDRAFVVRPSDLIGIHASVSALELDRILDCARDLTGVLDPARDFTQGLTRDLASACASAVELGRILDLDSAVDFGRAIDRLVQSAIDWTEKLVSHLYAGKIDACGADLSALDLTDMSVLEGVVWTERTRWPPRVHGRVLLRSYEIRPGVYQVRGGNEWSPTELMAT